MAAAKAEDLATEHGVTLDMAEEALDRAGEDVSEAESLIENRYVALKGRFSAEESALYGLFMIDLEINPPGLKQLSVLVGNDNAIVNVSIQQEHSDFLESMDNVDSRSSRMGALTDDLEQALNQEFAPPSSEWMEMITQRLEMELQDELESFVADTVDEERVVLTMELEEYLPESESTDTSDPAPSSSTESSDDSTSRYEDDSTTILKCNVKVSPVAGVPARSLTKGDYLYVAVQDGQDQHRRLINVLQGYEDDEYGMVPAPIAYRGRTETGKFEFFVRFGDEVFGKTIVGEDMNVLVPSMDNSSSGGFSIQWDWVVGALVLLMGLVALYIAFFLL